MHVLFIFFSLAKITIINNIKHLYYNSRFFHGTCMAYIFPRKYITKENYSKWNYIFLSFLWFTTYLTRKKQFHWLNKNPTEKYFNLDMQYFSQVYLMIRNLENFIWTDLEQICVVKHFPNPFHFQIIKEKRKLIFLIANGLAQRDQPAGNGFSARARAWEGRRTARLGLRPKAFWPGSAEAEAMPALRRCGGAARPRGRRPSPAVTRRASGRMQFVRRWRRREGS
jgi:hypothetical protein